MPGVDPALTDEPRQLAMAARTHLRERFLRAKVAISGANFAVAETGTLLVVESEGNGRMCLDPARDADHRDGHREGRAHVARPRGLPAAAAPLLHRRADEPLHVAVDRRHPRRRAAGVPPGAARQRPHRRARPTRSGRVGAALHPLLGLPQRLPGLRARRRARLRLGLPGPDRRRAVAAAHRGGGQRLAAVRVVACAGPASTPARSASTSRACSCTCAPRTSRRTGSRARAHAGGARHGRRRVGDGRPAAVRRRREGHPGRPAARPGRGPDHHPAAAAVALDRQPRRPPPTRRDLPRVVGPRAARAVRS